MKIDDIFSMLYGLNKPSHGTNEFLTLNDNIQFTQNLFGTEEELKQKKLRVIDKAIDGSCLCLADNEYLVDVDYRDIKSIV